MKPSSHIVGVRTLVEQERGRWVVFMEITEWMEDGTDEVGPLHMRRLRIEDYATKARAEVAARWIERTADRTPDIRWMRSL